MYIYIHIYIYIYFTYKYNRKMESLIISQGHDRFITSKSDGALPSDIFWLFPF